MKTIRLLVAALVTVSVLGPATAVVGAQSDGQPECEFPVELTDATGETVRVAEEPQRVVTLNPSAAQTMWEMGAQDKVVGVTKYAMYLDGASEKDNVSGSGETISNERVVGQNPDLVLAPNASLDSAGVEKLRESGLTVYHFREAESLGDIQNKTALIGQLTGECEAAAGVNDRMSTELSTIDEAVADEERPDVLYVFFGYTAGENTFIHMAIERAGGNNVAAEVGLEGYKPISQEVVANQSIDWLILNSDQPTVPKSAAYNSTTAVERDQVVVVDGNYVSQPAPRIVSVVSNLAQAFHPDAYAAANATATATGTPGDGTATATATATAESTPGGAGPGFGVASGLAAALGAALLARRTQG